MEIFILLIVVALLAGMVLGPVGCFKSFAVDSRLSRLRREVDRLAVQLRDTEAVCQKLRADLRSSTGSGFVAPDTGPAVTVETTGREPRPQPVGASESADSVKVDIESDQTMPPDDQPTTLEHLRKLRHEQQQYEPDTDADVLQEDATLEPLPAVVKMTESREPVQAAEATPRLSIEEVLAGKVFVWIGAIALVLTAAFLLKLGFDRNIITEPVRVIGAAAFGIALWCVGEWARTRVSLIAQALCGAAVAVLYASVLSAHKLYGLFGPGGDTLAFGLMATITAAAILLSLRHGPAVAILGMLGGFMLPPLLVQDFSPNAGMILYLLAIEIGVLAVTG